MVGDSLLNENVTIIIYYEMHSLLQFCWPSYEKQNMWELILGIMVVKNAF